MDGLQTSKEGDSVPLVIATNVAEMRSRRHIDRVERLSRRTHERVASGDRINSGADDAAGLAIAERVGAHRRSLGAAMRNAGDGISVMQTAEGAMQTQTAILSKMRQMAVQAANGTMTYQDRQALQVEIQQLKAELDRIGDDTEYNSAALLDGSYQDKTIRLSALAGDDVDRSFDLSLADVRSSKLGAVATATGSTALNIGVGTLSINGVAVDASDADDDTRSTVDNDRSAIAKAAAINKTASTHGVTASVGVTTATAPGAVGGGALAAGEFVINQTDIVVSGDRKSVA